MATRDKSFSEEMGSPKIIDFGGGSPSRGQSKVENDSFADSIAAPMCSKLRRRVST